MTSNPNPDADHNHDNDHGRWTRHDRQAPAAPYRDPGAASPAWTDAFARRYRLTQAGERYLHFNGAYYNGPYLVIDHDRCLTGACGYQTEAENRDEFETWEAAQDRESATGDLEAEL